MNIDWSFKREDQINYYIKQASLIENGFFQKIRAVILPYPHPDGWYLPDYDLFQNNEFTSRLHDVSIENFEVRDKKLFDIVSEVFDLEVTLENCEQGQWFFNERKDAFLSKTIEFFPEASSIDSVTILPTKFGTGSSYYHEGKDHIRLLITYRLDGSFERIFKSLLSTIVYISIDADDRSASLETWKMRKAIDDFLSNHTLFEKFFLEIKGSKTLQFMGDYKGKLLEDTTKYFAKMGYPLQSSFSITNGSVLFNDRPVLGLSNKEIEILEVLISRKSQIVTFDELGDVYWKDDPDKFSLAGLAKVIEKLRNNLEKNGISESYIRTVRKRGYLLFD